MNNPTGQQTATELSDARLLDPSIAIDGVKVLPDDLEALSAFRLICQDQELALQLADSGRIAKAKSDMARFLVDEGEDLLNALAEAAAALPDSH